MIYLFSIIEGERENIQIMTKATSHHVDEILT